MKLITDGDALTRFCDHAAQFDYITVDTEFLRETTYWPQLCLIQAATDEEAVLIDPLANGADLGPFFALLQNPNVTKVFHAARQDVEIFVHLSGEVPVNLYDTQVAASVCGYGDSVSYDNLVQAIVGAKVDKSSRFTDWSTRPLSDKQLAYALADVTHLRDIYKSLRQAIADSGREDWVADENEALHNIDTYVVKPENAWQRMKMKVHKARDLAAMIRLAEWREQRAQSQDQPRSRILKDDAIYELAVQRPTAPERFDRLRAVPRGFGRSTSANEIIAILGQVEGLSKDALPKLPFRPKGPSPKGAIGDLIRVLLKAVAEQQGVAARIIATSDDIDAMVLDDMADVPALKGWRRRIFGDKALAIKHGRLALAADSNGITEIEIRQS